MYKIMQKLHTLTDNVYRFYTIVKDGKRVEYETDNLEELINTALELMKFCGYDDVKVVNDKEFYIDVEKTDDPGIKPEDLDELLKLLAVVGADDLTLTHDAGYGRNWHGGKRPDPEVETYTLTVSGDTIIADPALITGIKPEDINIVEISFNHIPMQGHLNVNGVDIDNPKEYGIERKMITDTTYELIFTNINEDKNVIIVEDVAPSI